MIAAGLSLGSPNDVNGFAESSTAMTTNSPAENRNDHLRSMSSAPATHVQTPRSREGITPQKPKTMPRAEDDEETFERSPEFNDHPS
jgi:hypothetical protein